MSTGPDSISVIATVRNERTGIRPFIESLLAQSRAPDEILIVDGKSTDGTLEILREYESAGKIRVISQDCNIAQGRNLGVAAASHNLIAVTDAGCTAMPGWLQKIAECFASAQRPDVVAGNYDFETHNDFERASVLATDSPHRESSDLARFYPSSRSIAFRRAAWQAAKGYPEWLYAAEDTLFNIRLRELGFRFAFCKDAIVRWRPRTTWKALYRQHFNYARGNGRIGLGQAGYYTNIQNHAAFVLFMIAGLFWWPLLLLAAAVAVGHVRRYYWKQAQFAARKSGNPAMRWRVPAVMELVRLAGMAGFLAGRGDRWREPSFIQAQLAWLGRDSVETRAPPLPSWRTVATTLALPLQAGLILWEWRWAALGPAGLVTLFFLGKSIKNYSRTGPELKEEIRRHYAAYSVFAFARLCAWTLLICLLMAGTGLLVAEGAARSALGVPAWPALAWVAALSGIVTVTAFQFSSHLLHIPGNIAASSNYRLSRFYPLWNLLTPVRLRVARYTLIGIGATGALLAIAGSVWLGQEADAARFAASTLLYVVIVGAATWSADTVPSGTNVARRAANGKLNVLMIGVDTLRADRIGAMRDGASLTPNIDALAARGTWLTNCYVPCARTAPSLASLLTGTWPRHHGIRDNFVAADEVALGDCTLPKLLAEAGYRTVAVSDWAGADLGKFDFGFVHTDVSEDQWNIKYLIRQGPKDIRLFLSLFAHNRFGRRFLPEIYYLGGKPMTDELGRSTRRLLTECAHGDEPFFMNVFFSTTHAPFASEYPYYCLFSPREYSGESKFVMELLNDPFEIIKKQRLTGKDFDVRQILALYDGCVRKFDDEVGRVLQHLEQLGLREQTIIVLYSDHGVEFFERESWGQGNSVVVDGSARIPVVIIDPRQQAGVAIDDVTRSIDVAPTLLDLLGRPVPAEMEGVSLAGRFNDGAEELDLVAYGETGLWFTRIPGLPEDHLTYPDLQELLEVPDKASGALSVKASYKPLIIAAKDRMVRHRQWKLVRFAVNGGARFSLFDMDADPHCLTDVACEHSELVSALQERLDAMLDNPPVAGDPVESGTTIPALTRDGNPALRINAG